MAKEFYIRTMRAGRYCKIVRYSRALPSDNKYMRQAKQAATNAAQRYINVKNAAEKLQLLLCANFDRKDACFCTFTFDDDNLPANRKHAQRIIASTFSALRRDFRQQGKEMKYIYTVEGEALADCPEAAPVVSQQWEITPWRDSDRWPAMDGIATQETPETPTRFHVHAFLLLQKTEYETVRAFWHYGHVYINPMKVNDLTTFQRLANYVTKEMRQDQQPNGARVYTPSLNLERPICEGHWCSEFESIVLPHNAEELSRGSDINDIYGTSVEYLYCRLPRPQPQPQPYKGNGRISRNRTKSRKTS